MKKTTIIGLSLILGLALMATVALAWGPGFGPRFGRGFGAPPIPDLTAEQSARIQALQKDLSGAIEPLQKDLYAKGQELRSLWQSPNPDQTAITAKQKEMFELQSQLREKATQLRLEIRKVLTPEQLAKMPGFSQETGSGPRGFGPRMGMRGPFGGW